ncbi:MAG: PAS domain S-box protein [Acidimicrobiales bacterium]
MRAERADATGMTGAPSTTDDDGSGLAGAGVAPADVLAAVTSLVVVVDAHGQIVDLNPAAAAFVGRSVDEARGGAFVELFAPVQNRTTPFDLAAETGIELLLTHISPDGSERRVRWTSAALTDASGTVEHSVATGVDVTAEEAAREHLVESGRRYLALLDNASDLVICVDADGRMTHLSDPLHARLGHDPAEWLGRKAFDLIHQDDLEAALESFDATVALADDVSPLTLRVRKAAGDWIPFEVFAKNQLDNPDVAAIVVSMRDVTERRRHEAELEESRAALRLAERQFRSSFDRAPIGMALVGLGGEFLRVNTALCDLVGRDQAELLTLSFQDITHPVDVDVDLAMRQALISGEFDEYQLDKRYRRPDGAVVWAQLNVSLVRDQNGDPIHFVSQIQDITERRSQHDDLVKQANHDSLTDLVNRARFEDQLVEACAAALDHGPVSVVFLDLNEFKAINDTYGHAAGDLVLQQSAQRMRGALRPGDLAGRIGGDELAAILFGADEAVAEQVTERLRQAIAEPMDVNGLQLTLSASIGHVTTRTPVDAEQLLIQADVAMYADKRSRR